MQRIKYLVQKEFRQIFREKANLGIIFLMPFVQLLILGFAITTDIKNIKLIIVDKDRTSLSQQVVESFYSSDIFHFQGLASSEKEAILQMDRGRSQTILVIPYNFKRSLETNNQANVQLILDGVDGNSAGIAAGYASQILNTLQQKWIVSKLAKTGNTKIPVHQIILEPRMLYNSSLEGKRNIVPGIVAMLVTMITLFLTAINVVKEKERGTLEQLMVTPLKGYEIIIGKMIPFAILGFALLNVGILAAGVFFGIWISGHLLTLYLLSIIYMGTTLGLGILISTLANNQQQAMLMAWFFSIFSLLLSGFFVPIENMPDVIQLITYLNPLRYYLEVVRGIFLKGSGLFDLWPELLAMTTFGVLIISLASVRFQKRLK